MQNFLQYAYPTSPRAKRLGFEKAGCYFYEAGNDLFAFASEAEAVQHANDNGNNLMLFDVKGNHKKLTGGSANATQH